MRIIDRLETERGIGWIEQEKLSRLRRGNPFPPVPLCLTALGGSFVFCFIGAAQVDIRRNSNDIHSANLLHFQDVYLEETSRIWGYRYRKCDSSLRCLFIVFVHRTAAGISSGEKRSHGLTAGLSKPRHIIQPIYGQN